MTKSEFKTAAIIVAAGRGHRAGGGLPKQWRPLSGKRVTDWTIGAFADHPLIDEVVLVIHPDDKEHVIGLNLNVTLGGASRDASVQAGLEALKDRNFSHVLIHDAARAGISSSIISAVIKTLHSGAEGAAPALPITDALWSATAGKVQNARDRTGLFRAQTPQGFSYQAILEAHRSHCGGAADDVEVAQAAGIEVTVVPGEENNLKITTQDDFKRLERNLRGSMDIRVGNGFDVHAFEAGNHVMLCGVRVPHNQGLKGHSDADVGLHAITDAIYGAMSEGDIGRHFPPDNVEWQDADSSIFLRHAVNLTIQRSFMISNIDCTLICEHPKISRHAEAMITRISEITGVEINRISIKATTSEKLGFTGRSEGIAALATITLVKP
ncbi:bifunctional 2-C-methyl-D-erythritol 4-phosphate cytidylyltransferase/2-C-methyl-D-erythritol 2,4-cyclodiphosphate synthase [Pseudopelagicola sp. nBUS_20]|uniref:bifunctional 2-C-methyl-D-erythritol 4-phosphate cytidylyltransferase/2-C-methyl-D-erythritol 2,4-cyclodiphosphate synthase n=1 Tax=Pseudopelagicola sp. nBUS_20 TaxID=3395317 RepID=UPI003EB6DD5E